MVTVYGLYVGSIAVLGTGIAFLHWCICVCLSVTGQRYVTLQMLKEAESKGYVCIYAEDAFLCWESAQGSQTRCILTIQPALPVHSIYIRTAHDLKTILKQRLTYVPDMCCFYQDDPAPIHRARGQTEWLDEDEYDINEYDMAFRLGRSKCSWACGIDFGAMC